jgi:hypothetical protein
VGELVTLDLREDSPELALPWIITFAPLDGTGAWEAVVCGPYERAHALSLAETVVADEALMAFVGPVLPHASVDEIRDEIASARLAAEAEEEDDEEFELDLDETLAAEDVEVTVDDEYEDGDEDGDEDVDEDVYDADHVDEDLDLVEVELMSPPSPEEVRAGFARIAARLSTG